MSDYIIIDQDNQINFAKSLRDIERKFSIDHSYLSKLIKKRNEYDPIKVKKHQIFIQNNDESNKNFHYFLYNNENKEYKIYNSLREIEKNTGLDHSSLSKYINNKKYRSIGGGNRGRPSKIQINTCEQTNMNTDFSILESDNNLKKGYKIFKII